VLHEIAVFRKHVTPAYGNNRVCFRNLRRLLQSLCLRRTRSMLGFPEPANNTLQLTISEREEKAYSYLTKSWRRNIDMAVGGRNQKKVNQCVLQCIMRMRIFCNDGQDMSSHSLSSNFPSDPEEALSFLQSSGDARCNSCQCDILSIGQRDGQSSGTLTLCNHLLCGECLPQYESDLRDTLIGGKAQCPSCEHEGNIEDFLRSAPNEVESDAAGASFSTKIRSVVDNLKLQNSEDKR